MNSITLNQLNYIRSNIQQLVNQDEVELEDLLLISPLLSLTQPVFFDELLLIINNINKNNVKGDIIEAGVWQGATAIYIKALLNYTKSTRILWLLDLFDEKIDATRLKHTKDIKTLAYFLNLGDKIFTNYNKVVSNFKKFDLLDDKIKFIKGDVFDTFKSCNTEEIAILRLDLDFYEPTMFMLENFYERVTKGGYIIIDDYWVSHFNCKEAVDQFRKENKITSELISVGDFVAYWKK